VLGVILFAVGVGSTGLLTKKTISLIYVTYCICGGLGSGFAYGACISCIQKWLPHRRGFASGLAVSAFGLSTVVFTPVSNALMNVFKTGDAIIDDTVSTITVNFQAVFFILAAVFFVLGIIACLFISLPDEEYLKSLKLPAKSASGIKTRDYTIKEAIKTVPFWCIFFSIFFINGTWNLTSPIIKTLGEARGLTAAQAVFAVSFTGIPNAAGRLIMATLSDKIGRIPSILILCAMTFVGAILMTFVTGIPYIIVVAIIAFAYGGPSAINAAMTTDFFGSKNSGTNYGVAMLALGFSSIFFNAISANILKSNPVPTFIMGAVTAVIPVFLMAVIAKYQKKMKN
jgi:OFA family oxalate/formate antiporter-like MFS transporter